jgi:hypothetical protein
MSGTMMPVALITDVYRATDTIAIAIATTVHTMENIPAAGIHIQITLLNRCTGTKPEHEQ